MNLSEEKEMKIVRFPDGFPAEDLQILADKLKEECPHENVIFISDAIDIYDIPVQNLYELRKMIDKEISDREMLVPGERNEL